MHLVSIRTTRFTQQKQWGLYQNKVTSSLAAMQRPGHWADNCKMVYYSYNLKKLSQKSCHPAAGNRAYIMLPGRQSMDK